MVYQNSLVAVFATTAKATGNYGGKTLNWTGEFLSRVPLVTSGFPDYILAVSTEEQLFR